MRTLTGTENVLDNNGEADEGFEPIEATVQELADRGVGTWCGTHGNRAFDHLTPLFSNRRVRAWFGVMGGEPVVGGMIQIECTTEEAHDIEHATSEAGGSLRFNCDLGGGFCDFENE